MIKRFCRLTGSLSKTGLGLLCMLGLLIPMSIRAEVITGKELVLKKTVADTQLLRYFAFTGDVLVGGGHTNDLLQFFDISDPLDPKLAHSYQISERLSALAANGNYVYSGHYLSSPRQGWLDIFDVTDPYAPDLVCHHSARDLVTGISMLSQDVLLLCDDDAGLSILDVSDFDNPSQIDTHWQLNAVNVAISGDYAAVCDATHNNNILYIYDISSKTDIVPVGSIPIPGMTSGLAYEGSIIYAAQRDSGVIIIDASDPSSPILTSTISGIGTAWNLDLVGSTLYVASSLNLYIYDVSDPASPVKQYECPTDGEAWCVIVKNSIIYVGTVNSLQVFQLEDAKEKELVLTGKVEETLQLLHLEISGDVIAAGGYYNDSIKIFDIADPSSPTLASSYSLPDTFTSLSFDGSNVFCSNSVGSPRRGWLDILDVTDPYAPSVLSHYQTNDVAAGVDFENDVVMVGDDEAGLMMLDVADLSNPAILSIFPSQIDAGYVKINGDLAAVRQATSDAHRLVMYDISNKSSIVRLGSLALPDMMQDMIFKGTTVYIAQNDAGIYICDVSDPSNPMIASTITGNGRVSGVDIVGTDLYVASDDNILIYDVTEITSPELKLRSPVDGLARTIGVKGSLVAVGTNNSLLLFNLQNVADIDIDKMALDYLEGGEYAVDVEEPMSVVATARDLVISNLGESDLTINELNFDFGTHFSLDNPPELPAVIAGSEILTLHVKFEPQVHVRTLNLTDTLTIVSDDNDESEVSITLTGDAVPVELSSFSVE